MTESPDSQAVASDQRAAARAREKNTRRIQIVGFGLMAVFFGVQLFMSVRDGSGGGAGTVALSIAVMLVAIALIGVWVNRPTFVLRKLDTRAELGHTIDRSRDPMLRERLIWVEFAMAVASLDGAQGVDAPKSFALEATDAERRVRMGPKSLRPVGQAVLAARKLRGEDRWLALVEAARLDRKLRGKV
jgi:hypothetical protein